MSGNMSDSVDQTDDDCGHERLLGAPHLEELPDEDVASIQRVFRDNFAPLIRLSSTNIFAL